MTREEEIKKRLFEISTSNFNNSVVDSSAYFAGYVDAVKWADTHPHWISVKERKPKFKHKNDGFQYSETVIVTDGEYCTSANWAHSTLAGWYGWFDRGAEELKGVTHWMPMPSVEHLKKGDKNE